MGEKLLSRMDKTVSLAYCACGAVFEIARIYYRENLTNAWLRKPCPVCHKTDRIWKTAEIGTEGKS